LSKSAEARAIRLALNIEDRALADRVAALLANVPGLRLVRGNESADVALVAPTVVSVSADGDVPLTPRELEVLTPFPQSSFPRRTTAAGSGVQAFLILTNA
jgi:hypothetical protein